ncbi:hypothetical protein DAI22_03g243200 [Oryza sativa Japonica Group]|nr:hypothetical protein DAI22_03g243200 [Oryza sativa Japonica Group]
MARPSPSIRYLRRGTRLHSYSLTSPISASVSSLGCPRPPRWPPWCGKRGEEAGGEDLEATLPLHLKRLARHGSISSSSLAPHLERALMPLE